ncbi:hypothetical protein TBLA_0E00550 [Henningerozyma blattae CBS 6284]|uniref:Methylthioribose-1-phosphate isomerase n=1 Tax=Henningerozyma blattae (strain ATCC 34711 / CBS 6284 / DSM 70876 / NBRC 10599 / NRRL Y-10934 / UCD 77-7) TaxID=1071380 RepID=I2H414_HENB6|nr:hypothetical protein TBLA_0E00550 [Tetrapisispora blattae CBS 6284]CCH61116.1 hypothetical protein TBLA_0E00550 [Tetrapisispora blattae CBS 6284]
MSLEAIRFNRINPKKISVEVLDQLLLPYVTKYLPIYNISDGYAVIKSMQVRGAPAIAIVGALSVLLETQHLLNTQDKLETSIYGSDLQNWGAIKFKLFTRLDFLLSSRPTAVNLSNALKDIRLIALDPKITSLESFNQFLFTFVCKLVDDDLSNNIKMGNNGAKFLLDSLKAENFNEDFAVLTICNTGSLATSGYGTALGVIRSLWNDSQSKVGLLPSEQALSDSKAKLTHVYPLETRPYNQGSRLTAYELIHDKIPTTLITDSSIAYRIKTSKIPIKAAFVGADRIVRNGDTANKIGTFQLAIICKQFGIKFFVVAPKTTIDNVTETGDGIIVEERKPNEMKLVTGTSMHPETEEVLIDEKSGSIMTHKVGIAPPDVDVWNPSFDVTPYNFITGIVTEEGVFTRNPKTDKFELDELF